jgi:hypothetical protein
MIFFRSGVSIARSVGKASKRRVANLQEIQKNPNMNDVKKRKQGGGGGGEARKKKFFSDVRIFKYFYNIAMLTQSNLCVL